MQVKNRAARWRSLWMLRVLLGGALLVGPLLAADEPAPAAGAPPAGAGAPPDAASPRAAPPPALPAAGDWLDDPLRWEARSRVVKSALVLEAEVLDTRLTTVPREGSDGSESGCEWLSEVQLRPLAIIWGDCADDTVRAFSAAVPAALDRIGAVAAFIDSAGDGGCAAAALGRSGAVLSEPGTVGLFELQEKGPVAGRLNLGAVRFDFQRRAVGDSVHIPATPAAAAHTWTYEAFKSALVAAARTRTLDGILAGGEVIVLVEATPWKERERSRNVRSGRIVARLPVALERVYRGGAVPDSCGLVIQIKPAKRSRKRHPQRTRRRVDESRRLAGIIRDAPTSRLLVVGRIDSTDIFPADCVPVDAGGRLLVRQPTVTHGALQIFRTYELAELEARLGVSAPAR